MRICKVSRSTIRPHLQVFLSSDFFCLFVGGCLIATEHKEPLHQVFLNLRNFKRHGLQLPEFPSQHGWLWNSGCCSPYLLKCTEVEKHCFGWANLTFQQFSSLPQLSNDLGSPMALGCPVQSVLLF
uniref:Uncharacterized protein n=1 Tax=Micrurus surinamensis TaxID=129470 RepID=A0A2D4PK10_MICSU